MSEDRSWMYHRLVDQVVSVEFRNGVERFIQFALRNPIEAVDCEGRIRCPCLVCKNFKWLTIWEVQHHLYMKGFVKGYTNWTCHGETYRSYEPANVGGGSSYVDMVMDAAGLGNNVREEPVYNEELPNKTAERFYQLLKDADEPLWNGCQKHTRLSAVSQLLNFKSEFHISESCFDRLILLIKSMLPPDEKLPANFYRAKKMVNDLELGYVKIDACLNHCMLYYKEDAYKVSCSICHHDRYKPKRRNNSLQKDVPYRSLRYFPLTPRLQRMYMSSKTARHMRWHAERVRRDEDIISHPADGEAWTHFNSVHPTFSREPRNVRLGLCTDGFNPFGGSAASYSCWPVFVTPYNLPPSMCMKRDNLFLSLLIPGPKNPGKNIDIYLRPLIDELKLLWIDGVNTYDVFRKQNFLMKAALMWTISDFPAYGMLSGWSTHGRLACPYCIDNPKSFVLKHGGKSCWFDCHRQFLPRDHPFRRQKDAFLKNKIEMDEVDLDRFCGPHIADLVKNFPDITRISGSTRHLPGFGKEHNWVKKSIFWELPYWSTLLVRHNLDVMHVEKNVFDNVFNTIMDLKDKTKDNVKARLDLAILCKRPELELIDINGKLVKPKATYVLGDGQIKEVCQWLKQLRFPDGYVSNIARCVNITEGKIYGMKSHDCHVFMQRLIPIAFRDMLPKSIWGALTELSNFFKILCASELRLEDVQSIEQNVVTTICKLEKILPPSFFDSMEHLLIHLPYEAKVGGPVQYRWMYPFERCMHDLKMKVRNKAKVEGSIAEAYIIEEISNFCSMYFEPEIQTRRTLPPRNDDGGETSESNRLSIFKHPGRAYGHCSTRVLDDRELSAAEIYILLNCTEFVSYVKQFDLELVQRYPLLTDVEVEKEREKSLALWLKSRVQQGFITDQRIREIIYGPSKIVCAYPGYIVNGYRFHEMTLNRPPTFSEVFDETHKKKGSDQYISDRAREVAETYSRHMSDKYGEEGPQPQFDPNVWVAASGAPKKGHVYGFGHSLDTSHVISACSSSASHATGTFTTPSTAASDDVMGMIQNQISGLETRLFTQLSQSVSQSVCHAISHQLSQTVSQAVTHALSQSHFQTGTSSHIPPSTAAQPPYVPPSGYVEGDEDDDEDVHDQDL